MGKKPLEIDMIAGSQLRDTQGEMLSVEGADITELLAGRGRFNDNHGKGFFNSIGRVTEAKKIYGPEDCDNDRHTYFWEKVKSPYIYVKGILFDDDEHPNAKAAAAILRNIHKSDSPLKLKASVEGGVLARGMRDESLLARTKIHSVALTFTPANNATLVEPVSLEKGSVNEEEDRLLIKSVMHLARTDVPSFRHITRRASAEKISENLRKAREMADSAGLKTQVPHFTPDELIAQALEHKISENVNKINGLVKGAMRRLAPVKGESQDYQKVKRWVDGDPGEGMSGKPEAREEVPRLEGPYRIRAIHKLFSKTDHRVNPDTGDLEFLLHRGMNVKEADKHRSSGVDTKTSWTYDHDTASAFSGPKGHGGLAASAWIPEKHIHHFPGMLPDETLQAYKDEGEIIVAPHKLAIHSVYTKDKGHMRNEPHMNPSYPEWQKRPMPSSKNPALDFNKALTAGYGGGAPGQRTGGAVLQSEKLDDGRSGFKYVTCKDCGHEQVYMKHQVKCRQCNKHMSLADLYKVMMQAK